MYHIFPVGIISVCFYLFSYILFRTGYIEKKVQRKLWNTILAISFFLTALAGILLALHANYKWDLPIAKSILKWHVETGLGFSFAAVIHFIFHFQYYFGKGNEVLKIDNTAGEESLPLQNVRSYLFAVGFTSTAFQILLLREIINVAGGYELIASIFLGIWLVVSAVGASISANANTVTPKRAMILFAVCMVLTMIMFPVSSGLLLEPGETPGLFSGIIIILVTLFPVTFASGYTFIALLKHSRRETGENGSGSFAIETAGGIISGITVTLLLGTIINTYRLIILIILLVFFLTSIFSSSKRKWQLVFGIVFILSAFAMIFIDADLFFRRQLMKGIDVESTTDTRYGNISVSNYGGERSIYYDQRLIKWEYDQQAAEENIHFAMLQRLNVSEVLLLSGNPVSCLDELRKYAGVTVTYVERDPGLIDAYRIQESHGVNVIAEDPFSFLRKTEKRFDVIIILLPPPNTFFLNRYYTSSFYRLVRSRMAAGGVLSVSPGSTENYYNKESLKAYSSVFVSLKNAFVNVIPVAGNKLFFISSDSLVSPTVAGDGNVITKNNTFVNSSYFPNDLMATKSEEILDQLSRLKVDNSVDRPVAVFNYQALSLSRSPVGSVPSLIAILLLALLPALKVRRHTFPMYAASMSLAGVEILILILMQSATGSLYLFAGLLFSVMLAGLALGSYWRHSRFCPREVNTSLLLLLLYYLVTALLVKVFQEDAISTFPMPILLLLIFIPSFLTGALFRLMTGEIDAARVYSADLAGSAAGFILLPLIVIPLAGIFYSFLVAAGLIFTGLIFGTLGNKL
ncbi:MAG: hypothetical protein U0X39_10110 [Bacteroidales bacterium]